VAGSLVLGSVVVVNLARFGLSCSYEQIGSRGGMGVSRGGDR
jgi:hypothetical protein